MLATRDPIGEGVSERSQPYRLETAQTHSQQHTQPAAGQPCLNTAAVPFHADYLRHLRVGIKSSQKTQIGIESVGWGESVEIAIGFYGL